MAKMGEILKASEKNKGGNLATLKNVSTGSRKEPVEAPPTLASAGIPKKQSMNAQSLATVKEKKPELYEQVRSGKVSIAAARVELKRE